MKYLKLFLITSLMTFYQSHAQHIVSNNVFIKGTNGSHVVLSNGIYTLSGSHASYPTSLHHLTLSNNAVLTMPATACLTVNGTLNNESGTTLSISSGGSLITNGSITNNGTVNSQLTVSDGEYHIISPPNNNTLSGLFAGDYLLNWNEPGQDWSYITGTDVPLIPATGYFLWGVAKNTTHTFTGTPNTGNQSLPLTNTGSGDTPGFNLVGNPYPSALDWGLLDDTYGAVYYWNPETSTYVSWNNGVGEGTQYVAPMQGFFIYAPSTGSFLLYNSVRTHEGAANYYKSPDKGMIEGGLVLKASNMNVLDHLHLVFDDQAAAGFELQHDAWKLKSTQPGVIQLYSVCPDGNLSIDVRPTQETIPLGFALDYESWCTIAIVEYTDSEPIWLEDTKLNTFTELTSNDYSFQWLPTDDEHRFLLHRSVTSLPDRSSAHEVHIYASGNSLYLHSDTGPHEGLVELVDMAGRVVMTRMITLNINTELVLTLKPGIYLMRFKTSRQTVAQKVLIH